ncbi:unnamed protein product [Gordionus sp. m RMFG-2023]
MFAGAMAHLIRSKPNIIFVLGAPGAGKGTQSNKIVKEFGFIHLSAGDLLREEQTRENSKFSELIQYHIKNGSIVPVEITCKLIENAMLRSGKNNFLIDGFPRNQNNLEGWQKEMADKVNLKFVLIFDCSEKNCIDRCLKRGAMSGREDDNIESLKKRFHTFENSTLSIIDYYRKFNIVETLDANQTPNKVLFEK